MFLDVLLEDVSAFIFKELFLRRGRRVGGQTRSHLGVAQLEEHRTVNPVVAGSNPAPEISPGWIAQW